MPCRHKSYAGKILDGYQMKVSRTKKSNRLRFGVIGIGGMGLRYCRILGNMPRVRLAAVCDVNAKAAEEAGKKINALSFSSHLDLIRARCCDVVAIVTPHPFHCQAAVDCMNAGLHVLVEKPLTERVSTANSSNDFSLEQEERR